MTICLSKEGCQNNNITIGEALLMLIIHNSVDLDLAQDELIKKGYMTANRNNLFQQVGWRLTNRGSEVINSVIIDSEKVDNKLEFEELANKLREIFPNGKKPGTTYMWRDTTAVIAKKLKILVTKYNCNFTEEQAIKATQAYVNSFGGNYKYMQLLKYFILKTPTNASGDVELRSDFMSYVDNEGQEEQLREDWMSNMV